MCFGAYGKLVLSCRKISLIPPARNSTREFCFFVCIRQTKDTEGTRVSTHTPLPRPCSRKKKTGRNISIHTTYCCRHGDAAFSTYVVYHTLACSQIQPRINIHSYFHVVMDEATRDRHPTHVALTPGSWTNSGQLLDPTEDPWLKPAGRDRASSSARPTPRACKTSPAALSPPTTAFLAAADAPCSAPAEEAVSEASLTEQSYPRRSKTFSPASWRVAEQCSGGFCRWRKRALLVGNSSPQQVHAVGLHAGVVAEG